MPFTASSVWLDTPARYGRISRWLHWGMALLFAWQFIAAQYLGPDGDGGQCGTTGASVLSTYP